MVSKLIVLLFALIVVFGSAAGARAADSELRSWTDSTGQYRVRAAFVELKDGRVWLKKADGSTVGVPLDRLGAADRRADRDAGGERRRVRGVAHLSRTES